MAKINIKGVTLVYEIIGQGPALVFTPGGFWGMERARPVAEQLSALGYRVLIYDRPNCGASDLVIEESHSVFELFADYLHALLGQLRLSPAFVGGGSGGKLTSLLLAYRHPQDVKGLFLTSPPTDDPELWNTIAYETFLQPAEVAESKGMPAVIETGVSWFDWPERIKQNPANRDRLLRMDPQAFASVMRQWGAWCTSGRAHFGGLTDQEIGTITVPTIVVSGRNEAHPPHTAQNLHQLLPNSELIISSEYFSAPEWTRIYELAEQKGGEYFDVSLTPILADFVTRTATE